MMPHSRSSWFRKPIPRAGVFGHDPWRHGPGEDDSPEVAELGFLAAFGGGWEVIELSGDKPQWQAALGRWGITDEGHVRLGAEGGLWGSVPMHGINAQLVIVSEDAGQFNGRRGRDTLASLKKTRRKLGVWFWDSRTDRIGSKGLASNLPALIGAQALSP
ncbi:MAG: hypothetical protein JXP73_12095 [Deltaproteobacteria bacterium]|nr:hypothetical protein [Deltaproteobacteria bacterium]